jgi:lipopolysaccharide export system protein LptA
MKKALAVMLAVGISAAYAASSYRVTLSKPTTINGTQLSPGECKLELQGDKVVIKQGKTTVESSVTVENGTRKFDLTTVGYSGDGAGNFVRDIRLAGTTLKLLFDSSSKTEGAVAGR